MEKTFCIEKNRLDKKNEKDDRAQTELVKKNIISLLLLLQIIIK